MNDATLPADEEHEFYSRHENQIPQPQGQPRRRREQITGPVVSDPVVSDPVGTIPRTLLPPARPSSS